jgi:hypothetical protein
MLSSLKIWFVCGMGFRLDSSKDQMVMMRGFHQSNQNPNPMNKGLAANSV